MRTENDQELEEAVRDFTCIEEAVVGEEEFQTVLSDAKRHIKVRRSLFEEEIDWYGDDAQNEALNWATKLFLKVSAGDLDSAEVNVGNINETSLQAKNDNSYTVWYRNMESALRNVKPSTSYGIRSNERRTYGDDI